MKIRYGTKEDAEKISKCLKEMWFMHADQEPDYIDMEVLKKSDLKGYFKNCFDGSNKSYLLIAEKKEKLAGFCKLNIEKIQRFFKQRKVLYVDDVYILKDFRRKRVASTLLQEAERIANKRKIKWLKARVYTFNKPAQKLLNSLRYKSLYSEYFKILK